MTLLSKKPPVAKQFSAEYPLRATSSATFMNGNKEVAGYPPRTPSPTPSDLHELQKGALDWGKLMRWDTWLKKKYIWWYIALIICGVVVALVTIYHKQLVDWLTPVAKWAKDFPAGFLIPIAVMFVISFPPLFGHEIVAVLCGIVWGLWIGFGIVAAGTFIGEVGNFYAFRYVCLARGEKMEKNNLSYALLAKVIRDGGFMVALVARYSAIPGHFTTAVFSTCGMNIWIFCLGAFLSLPKQLVTVYLGVIIYEAADGQTTKEKIISASVLVVTTLATIFAAWWIYYKMNGIKAEVLRERRKARAIALYQEKAYNTSQTSDLESFNPPPFNPRPSLSDSESSSNVHLPLSVRPQRWDANGRAILENPHSFEFNDGSSRRWDSKKSEGSNRLNPPYQRSNTGNTATTPDITLTSANMNHMTPLPDADDATTPKVASFSKAPPQQSQQWQPTEQTQQQPQWSLTEHDVTSPGQGARQDFEVYNPYGGDPNHVATGGTMYAQQQSSGYGQYSQQQYTSRAERWEPTDATYDSYHTATSASPSRSPPPSQPTVPVWRQ